MDGIEEILDKQLLCDPASLVECLGGINHVVRLCLTHPKSMGNEEYLRNAFFSIKSMTKINTPINETTTYINTVTDLNEIIIYDDGIHDNFNSGRTNPHIQTTSALNNSDSQLTEINIPTVNTQHVESQSGSQLGLQLHDHELKLQSIPNLHIHFV